MWLFSLYALSSKFATIGRDIDEYNSKMLIINNEFTKINIIHFEGILLKCYRKWYFRL